MATKNLLMLKSHFDWINVWILYEFFYRNMIWLLGSLMLFLWNYVLSSFGLILKFLLRFQVGGDRKTESGSEIDGFGEEITNFLFQCYEDFLEDNGKNEEESQSSSFVEAISDVHEHRKTSERETVSSVLMKVHPEFREDEEKEAKTESSVIMDDHSDSCEDEGKGETGSSVSKELHSDYPEDGNKKEGETECSISMEVQSDSHGNKGKEGEPEVYVPTEVHYDFHENGGKGGEKKRCVSMEVQSHFAEDRKKGEGETQTDRSVLTEVHSSVHEDGKRREGGKSCVLMEADSAITTRKYQYVSRRNISGFMEEATAMSFSFREFYVGPNAPVVSDNAFSNSEITAQEKESSEHPEEEEVESAQENEFLGRNSSWEGLESEIPKGIKEESAEESGKSEAKDEKEGSNQQEEAYREKTEEWKKVLEELEADAEYEGEFEREHDDIVEQLKMELRNARQGGLPTIQEEEEEEEPETGETECPEEAEDQKLLKNEEFQDQMDEIDGVYMIYEEKMKKLDILNYQTMHALGLLQLKDPLKSTFMGMKPPISQNLWPRKEAKSPLEKLVEELQRDLEMVYVGQACLSWEMLRWQHKKAHQLKHFPSQYNIAAGEFQLFQVLLQRFIENEPFQGPRTHNFVKNRCVIRNLLQVPPIRDDSVKEKNIVKGDEEHVVSSAGLAEIIKESMWLFWRFVRADKEDGSSILRVSQQTRTDPALSDLVKDLRTHLHKKERKLKEMVRSGNCIVRKFQKQHQQIEEQLNHEQLLAQVELKLVSRVLNLPKLRKEHLIWCNEKLRRIKFLKKNILVEPSFLLFPC